MAENPVDIAENPVDIDAIIEEIMLEKGVNPEDIPEEEPFDLEQFIENLKDRNNWSLRYFRGRAHGQYKCKNILCENTWSSTRAWLILDLKEQTVERKLKEECASYEKHQDFEKLSLSESEPKPKLNFAKDSVGVYPTFEEEAVRYMVEWAVNKYLEMVGLKEKSNFHDRQRRVDGPHRQDLCEMCVRLGGPCWI